MSDSTNSEPDLEDDDMPADIDFSKAEVGRFYRPNVILHIPVYDESDE
jgi:hypothetical protein